MNRINSVRQSHQSLCMGASLILPQVAPEKASLAARTRVLMGDWRGGEWVLYYWLLSDGIEYDYKNEVLPQPTRFSINFFGYPGKKWHKISKCYGDDEREISQDLVQKQCFLNMLFPEFYVSHLSFGPQEKSGINSEELIPMYHQLFDQLNGEGYFDE